MAKAGASSPRRGDHRLANWAIDKGITVWQDDVALAALQVDASLSSPDPSALAHAQNDVTQRFAVAASPLRRAS